MKEIELNSKDNIEVSIKKQQEKQYTLIGNIIPHEGHTIYEINVETLEGQKAKFLTTNYYMFGENKKEIAIKQNCVYIAALNEKNALIKYNKGVSGGKNLGTEKMNWFK